jgi:hypothetical protein
MGSSCGTEASDVSDDRPPNHKVVTLATSSKATTVSATLGKAVSPRRQEKTAHAPSPTIPQAAVKPQAVGVRHVGPHQRSTTSHRNHHRRNSGDNQRRSLPPPATFTSVAVREEGYGAVAAATAAVDVKDPFGLFDVSDTNAMASFQLHTQPLPQRVRRSSPHATDASTSAFAVDPNEWSLLQSATLSVIAVTPVSR